MITESLDVPVQGELWKERGPVAPIITKGSAVSDQLLTLGGPPTERSSLAHLEHPVTAYLNGLAPSSRRPQLAALEAIARRSTQVFTAETMPWQRLRRPQVLKIRSLLEENYLPAVVGMDALRQQPAAGGGPNDQRPRAAGFGARHPGGVPLCRRSA